MFEWEIPFFHISCMFFSFFKIFLTFYFCWQREICITKVVASFIFHYVFTIHTYLCQNYFIFSQKFGGVETIFGNCLRLSYYDVLFYVAYCLCWLNLHFVRGIFFHRMKGCRDAWQTKTFIEEAVINNWKWNVWELVPHTNRFSEHF